MAWVLLWGDAISISTDPSRGQNVPLSYELVAVVGDAGLYRAKWGGGRWLLYLRCA